MPYKDPLVQKIRKKQIRENRLNFIRSLKSRPCTDCGVQYSWWIMQFDHLGDKDFTISRMGGTTMSIEKILKEVAKCEIVCANCHADRSYRRRTATLA